MAKTHVGSPSGSSPDLQCAGAYRRGASARQTTRILRVQAAPVHLRRRQRVRHVREARRPSRHCRGTAVPARANPRSASTVSTSVETAVTNTIPSDWWIRMDRGWPWRATLTMPRRRLTDDEEVDEHEGETDGEMFGFLTPHSADRRTPPCLVSHLRTLTTTTRKLGSTTTQQAILDSSRTIAPRGRGSSLSSPRAGSAAERPGWFLPGKFRFCLRCGATQGGAARDRNRLASLSARRTQFCHHCVGRQHTALDARRRVWPGTSSRGSFSASPTTVRTRRCNQDTSTTSSLSASCARGFSARSMQREPTGSAARRSGLRSSALLVSTGRIPSSGRSGYSNLTSVDSTCRKPKPLFAKCSLIASGSIRGEDGGTRIRISNNSILSPFNTWALANSLRMRSCSEAHHHCCDKRRQPPARRCTEPF